MGGASPTEDSSRLYSPNPLKGGHGALGLLGDLADPAYNISREAKAILGDQSLPWEGGRCTLERLRWGGRAMHPPHLPPRQSLPQDGPHIRGSL